MNLDRWRRIEELYHEVAQHRPEARRAFLLENCDGDVALRREVESLIEQYEAAAEFIETPALAQAKTQISSGGGGEVRWRSAAKRFSIFPSTAG